MPKHDPLPEPKEGEDIHREGRAIREACRQVAAYATATQGLDPSIMISLSVVCHAALQSIEYRLALRLARDEVDRIEAEASPAGPRRAGGAGQKLAIRP